MCTDIKIRTRPANCGPVEYVSARSQEFAYDLESKLIFRKAGNLYKQEYAQTLLKQHDLLQWKGKYGFVGTNAFYFPIVIDGINTEGLATGALWFGGAKYPNPKCADIRLSDFYFTEWLLSNFKDCHEVKEALSKENIAVLGIIDNDRQASPHHYPVHDKYGNSIVIEFIDGKIQITENNIIGVVTNEPEISWHMQNLNNYQQITPFNQQGFEDQPDSFNNFPCGKYPTVDYKNGIVGSGFSLIPGSPTPVDRYVRAAMMLNYAAPVATAEEATNLAIHILNTVDIPKGIVRFPKKNGEQNDYRLTNEFFKETKLKIPVKGDEITQYISIKDMSRQIYSIRFYDSPLVYSVDLKELDLDKLNGLIFPVAREPSIDLTSQINICAQITRPEEVCTA